MENNKFLKFGYTIKTLREKKKIKQAQLADDMGISRQSMSNYESGKHSPDIDIIVKMATYFDCSTDYLLGVSEFPHPEVQKFYCEDMSRLSDTLRNLPFPLREAWLDIFISTAECLQLSLTKDIMINQDMVSLHYLIIELMNLYLDTVDKQNNGEYAEQDIRNANNKLHSCLGKIRGEINYLDDKCYKCINPLKDNTDDVMNEKIANIQKELRKTMKGENE